VETVVGLRFGRGGGLKGNRDREYGRHGYGESCASAASFRSCSDLEIAS